MSACKTYLCVYAEALSSVLVTFFIVVGGERAGLLSVTSIRDLLESMVASASPSPAQSLKKPHSALHQISDREMDNSTTLPRHHQHQVETSLGNTDGKTQPL